MRGGRLDKEGWPASLMNNRWLLVMCGLYAMFLGIFSTGLRAVIGCIVCT